MGARVWAGYALMCVGMFMAILDIQIVAAALPQLSASLHIRLDQLSWVQTAYLVAEVVAVAFSGRLARVLSTTGLFTAAVGGFTLASIGCALSHDFGTLVAARTVQGLCGGAIIPTVFTAGFLQFSEAGRSRALLLAGSLATLAPPIGPLLGGAITASLSWQWLFLINVPAGIIVTATVIFLIRVDEPIFESWREIDAVALLALAVALSMLMILLKVGPQDHWAAWRDAGLVVLIVSGGTIGVRRCVASATPLVDLAPLRGRHVAIACTLNFILGAGLYGSVYVLPLFLGFVRRHGPLEIGLVMTVTGAAQLLCAPLATFAERRWPAAWVAGFGFVLFTAGLTMNGFQTPRTDAAGLFWPQVLRGASLLLCLMPITTIALEEHASEQLAHASALLNLMRNLGGAIGIALVDTLINMRPPVVGEHIGRQLLAGDRATAIFVGLPAAMFRGVPLHPTHAQQELARPLVERAAATVAFNEAWLLLAALMLVSFALLPFLRRPSKAIDVL